MGRLGHDPVIQHFSHPHPLELSNLQQSLAPSACAGCRLRTSGWIYSCKPCSYVLHITCAQMPQFINHPADPGHALALLAVPAYPEGCFDCDACGQKGAGFSYHCGVCNLDVHTLCASMPVSLTHHAHPHHQLALAFFPPYDNKGFSCDICGNMGTNHWLYRCAACEFDAHLGCASTKPRQQQAPPAQSYRPQQTQLVGVPLVGVPQRPQFQQAGPVVGMPTRQWQAPVGALPQAPNRMGSNNQTGNTLVDQAIQGFVQSAAQQAGQSLVQSIFGGGGNDGGSGGGGGNGDGGQDGSLNPVVSVIGAVFGGGGSGD